MPSVFPLCHPLLRHIYFRKKLLFIFVLRESCTKVTRDKQRASTSPLVTSWGKRGRGRGQLGRRRGWRIMSRFCPVPITTRLLLPGSHVDADVDNMQLSVFFFFIQNVGVLRDRCIVFHCRCLFYISFIFVCILYILQLPQYPWLIRVITERNYYFNTLKLAQTFLSSGVRG